jgi:hypothetical protein
MNYLGLREYKYLMNFAKVIMSLLILTGCEGQDESLAEESIHALDEATAEGIKLRALGNVQDAGSPQIGCQKTVVRTCS